MQELTTVKASTEWVSQKAQECLYKIQEKRQELYQARIVEEMNKRRGLWGNKEKWTIDKATNYLKEAENSSMCSYAPWVYWNSELEWTAKRLFKTCRASSDGFITLSSGDASDIQFFDTIWGTK